VPELPEVETVMRALSARLVGRRFTEVVQRRPDLRFPIPPGFVGHLLGRRVTGFARRAKFVVVLLDGPLTLLLHLGMSGRLLFDGEPRGVHEHLTFGFDDGAVLRFVDSRRFGLVDLVPADGLAACRWFTHLGLEPLSSELTPAALRRLLEGRRTALKVALMDQRLIVGVGNIYASEALFRARLAPQRPAGSLTQAEARRLVPAIKAVLSEAIEAGGSSLRDYVQTDGELGNFQSNFRVYDRAGHACTSCTGPIERIVQGARATFYCPICQR
jgi:formamidopyrimidine-DNA glycosylase